MSFPDVPIGRFNNVKKSCKVIECNPCGALELLESPREVGPSELLSSQELV